MTRPRTIPSLDITTETKTPADFSLACRAHSPQALAKLVSILTSEGSKDPDAIKAAEMILAYAWGKPNQRTELSGPDNTPLKIDMNMTLSDLDQQIAQLEGKLRKGNDDIW